MQVPWSDVALSRDAADASLRRWRNAIACLGLGAVAAFVAALVILHLAAGRSTPSHMSEFALSRFGFLWAMAVYTVVLGGAMLVWALRPCLADCPSKWIGIAMLWLAGVAAVLLAAFPADNVTVKSWSGQVHNDAAVSTFVLMGGAMVVLAPAFRASPGLHGFARVSVLLGVLVTASWVTYLVTTLEKLPGNGPAQRVLVGLITTWFVLIGLRVRAAANRPRYVAVRRRKVPVALAEAEAVVRRKSRARRSAKGTAKASAQRSRAQRVPRAT